MFADALDEVGIRHAGAADGGEVGMAVRRSVRLPDSGVFPPAEMSFVSPVISGRKRSAAEIVRGFDVDVPRDACPRWMVREVEGVSLSIQVRVGGASRSAIADAAEGATRGKADADAGSPPQTSTTAATTSRKKRRPMDAGRRRILRRALRRFVPEDLARALDAVPRAPKLPHRSGGQNRYAILYRLKRSGTRDA